MRSFLAGILLGSLLVATALAGPVSDAAKKGDVVEIERLLASGADANEPDAIASPLHWAAMKGHADAVELLAASGAILDAQSDMLGTPLHAAAGFGQADTVRALLAAGANPNTRDGDEFTPLIRAVMRNYLAPVEALLSAGADVNAVGIAPGSAEFGKGPTIALQLAIFNGHDEVAELLRASGAGPIPPEVPADLAKLGDPERGRELAYAYCDECHTIAAGDPAETGHAFTGPPLIGLIGRDVADLSGFDYTQALISHGGTWTPERFYAFALRPALTVPGTRMNWAPGRTPQMIADITAYFVSVAY